MVGKSRHKNLILVALGILVLVTMLSVSNSAKMSKNEAANNYIPIDLEMPSLDYIFENGYPTNEDGLTYGGYCYRLGYKPDLLLVCNKDGVFGYVYSAEFESDVITIEDAIEYTKTTDKQKAYKMYFQDGKTYLGEFVNH